MGGWVDGWMDGWETCRESRDAGTWDTVRYRKLS